MTPFKDNITKSIDNLNKLQEDVDNTITDLQEQVEKMEDLETKNVTITTNTETTIEPTSGKYALEKVVVTTNVAPVLQTKNVTVTENGTSEITADSEYQGLEKVKLTVNAGVSLNLTDGKYLFQDYSRLNKVNELLTNSEIIDAYYMFHNSTIVNNYSDSNFTGIPLFDCSHIQNAQNMFYNFSLANSLSTYKKLPALNFQRVTICNQMFAFSSLSSSQSMGFNDLSDVTIGSTVTNLSSMFQRNLSIVDKLPTFSDTSNVTNFSNMFSACNNLTTINQVFNMASATNIYNMVSSTQLTNESIHNIVKSLVTLTSTYTGTKTLATIGLNSTQQATAKTFDEWSTLEDNGWT